MTNEKKYDGLRVVEHCVQPGQTYSQLAKIYGLPAWKPIQIYNTQVRPVLASAKPEHLPVGRRVLIPRSPKGYERWAKSLTVTQAELEGFEIAELARLEAIDNEAKAGYVALDFTAEILTLFGSLAAKGRDAAKAATQAFDADLVDDPLANALNFSWANSDDFAFATEGMFERLRVALQAADKAVSMGLYEKLFDKLSGKNVALLRKLLKAGGSSWKAGSRKAIVAGVADGAKAVLEYLDYFKPSTWNKIMLVQLSGENVEQTVASQYEQLKKSIGRQIATLKAKREAVEQERILVWGK